MTVLSKVISVYYDLLTDQDNIHVAQEELASVQKLLSTQQDQVKLGATAASDMLRTREEVVARHQDLLAAENIFAQDSQSLKAEICKSFSEELANSEIVPPTNCLNRIPRMFLRWRRPCGSPPLIVQR